MASIKDWVIMGLIVNVVLIGSFAVFIDVTGNYGITSADYSGLNKTAAVMNQIRDAQTQIAGTTSTVTDFGIFTVASTAIGTVFNNFLNSFKLLIAMVEDFNSVIGGGILPGPVVGLIEGVILITITFFVARLVFGRDRVGE